MLLLFGLDFPSGPTVGKGAASVNATVTAAFVLINLGVSLWRKQRDGSRDFILLMFAVRVGELGLDFFRCATDGFDLAVHSVLLLFGFRVQAVERSDGNVVIGAVPFGAAVFSHVPVGGVFSGGHR
jgi:hypothetical protein